MPRKTNGSRGKGKAIIPRGSLILQAGDVVLLYEKHLKNENI